jgi:hypothetical protein
MLSLFQSLYYTNSDNTDNTDNTDNFTQNTTQKTQLDIYKNLIEGLTDDEIYIHNIPTCENMVELHKDNSSKDFNIIYFDYLEHAIETIKEIQMLKDVENKESKQIEQLHRNIIITPKKTATVRDCGSVIGSFGNKCLLRSISHGISIACGMQKECKNTWLSEKIETYLISEEFNEKLAVSGHDGNINTRHNSYMTLWEDNGNADFGILQYICGTYNIYINIYKSSGHVHENVYELCDEYVQVSAMNYNIEHYQDQIKTVNILEIDGMHFVYIIDIID